MSQPRVWRALVVGCAREDELNYRAALVQFQVEFTGWPAPELRGAPWALCVLCPGAGVSPDEVVAACTAGTPSAVALGPPWEQEHRLELPAEVLVLSPPPWVGLRKLACVVSNDLGHRGGRKEIRAPLSLPVFVHGGPWASPRRLRTVNLSQNGLAFTATEPLSQGTELRLALDVDGKRFRVRGSVKHATPRQQRASETEWHVGVMFASAPQEYRDLVAKHSPERYQDTTTVR